MRIYGLTVNPFQENTYVVADSAGQAAIIDPGMSTQAECAQLQELLREHGLSLTQVLLTHAHIDHILGCQWVADTYGLRPWLHPAEVQWLAALPQQSLMFGVPAGPAPEPAGMLSPGTAVQVGSLQLEVLFTPGHSPGSVCFYHRASAQVIGGDVLFQGSIGRTDLPGGDYAILMQSIFTTLLPLGDGVTIYPGHGPATTLGQERMANPFLAV